MFKLSQVLTELFSPFVLSGLLLVQIALATDTTWAAPAAICLIFIVGIPFALSWWMHATGRTSDRYIQDRRQRTPFYAATFASYLAGAVLLNIISTSSQVRLALNLSLISLVVVALVNLKIKVSVHALVAALFALVAPLYAPLPALGYALGALVWAATVWARWNLRKHTLGELALGTVFGALLALAYLTMR